MAVGKIVMVRCPRLLQVQTPGTSDILALQQALWKCQQPAELSYNVA